MTIYWPDLEISKVATTRPEAGFWDFLHDHFCENLQNGQKKWPIGQVLPTFFFKAKSSETRMFPRFFEGRGQMATFFLYFFKKLKNLN